MRDNAHYELPFRIAGLIKARISGVISTGEEAELRAWADEDPRNRALLEQFSPATWRGIENPLARYDSGSGLSAIKHKLAANAAKRTRIFSIARWAAAVIIPLALVTYWLATPVKHGNNNRGIAAMTDSVTGSNHQVAYLTSSEGDSVRLSPSRDTTYKLASGYTAQGQAGTLMIAPGSMGHGNDRSFTLITPKSGIYRIVLGDGSKAWLNAASSIRFPEKFDDRERRVTINGEVYIEVAKDASRPFRVDAAGSTIDVLGTNFNIKAYDPGSVTTTLVSGKVRVRNGVVSQVLSPGQQVSITGAAAAVRTADLEQVMAWKNGRFIYRKAGIRQIMDDLARWYDIEVTYSGSAVETGGITLDVSRDIPLAGILRMLELSGAGHFILKDNRITVQPD